MTLSPKVVTDQYHNKNIEDPYRYVENLSHPEVKKWIDTQNNLSRSYLKGIDKRQFLIDKQIELDEQNEFIITKLKVTKDDFHFYLKRLPSENVAKLYYRTSFNTKEVLLYDPTSFESSKHNEFIINYFQPDWKNENIVISITEKGKEISQLIIVNIHTKEIHRDILNNTWPSTTYGIEWLPNNAGFVYTYFPNAQDTSKNSLLDSASFLHYIGTQQAQDIPVFSKNFCPNLPIKSEDILITSIENQFSTHITAAAGGVNSYYDTYLLPVKYLGSNNWKLLFSKEDLIKDYKIVGDSIIFKTSYNAPNYKIGITSIKNPNFKKSRILVPEHENQVITDFTLTSQGLYYVTSKNGVEATLYKQIDQSRTKVSLPKSYGNILISSLGAQDPKLWISVKGWTTNSKRFEYVDDILTPKNIQHSAFDDVLENIIVEEVEVTAHDGEKIPLSIFYHKDMVKNGNNHLLMDGYGSYGISMRPSKHIHRTLWVLEGGVYAIAHVRGGGEKGSDWHKAGFKTSKPNTWKDFISCAEYLISNQYTSPKKLAILSGSAGGILIGRAMTERPDLFAAAIVEFGSLNMLRSEISDNGINNAKEFGSTKDPEEFEALLEMDAYHHIKKGEKYPAVFLTAGLNDPRVPAWFSAKFMAKLQTHDVSNNPKLLYVDANSGHGIDDTKTKIFERFANIIAFAFKQTGHPDYQF